MYFRGLSFSRMSQPSLVPAVFLLLHLPSAELKRTGCSAVQVRQDGGSYPPPAPRSTERWARFITARQVCHLIRAAAGEMQLWRGGVCRALVAPPEVQFPAPAW